MNSDFEKIYPFTEEHLQQFEKEMDDAEGFDLLMLEKEALNIDDGTSVVKMYADKEAYKRSSVRRQLFYFLQGWVF